MANEWQTNVAALRSTLASGEECELDLNSSIGRHRARYNTATERVEWLSSDGWTPLRWSLDSACRRWRPYHVPRIETGVATVTRRAPTHLQLCMPLDFSPFDEGTRVEYQIREVFDE